MKSYDHGKIEKKWQKEWAKKKTYATKDNSDKAKYYVLDMFPYPSGEGLHVGHPKGYIATDIVSRMKRMQGHNVLHPMGFDAFGLPAENYALKTKTNPQISVAKNVARYKKQLEILGFDYDWSREINTTDPKYYKWTQWIFLKLLEKGLAYESYEPINWCPSCKTGLANEDVEDGKCERCGTVVEKKPMRQWVLRITDYADRLLKDLDAAESAIPLFKRTIGTDAVKEGEPFDERTAVVSIIKHWSEDKYLCSEWKKNDWRGFIIGGVEKNENYISAALREIKEETGYTSGKFIKTIGKADAQFYQALKNVNRFAHFTCVYVELVNGDREEMTEDEKAIHNLSWLSREEMSKNLNRDDMKYFWDLFVGAKNQESEPLLDWPESIKEAQRNWIGRSEGMLFTAPVKDTNLTIQTFSAHFEAFAADTFVVIAPDHPFLKELVKGTASEKKVLAFAQLVTNDRLVTDYGEIKEPEGIFTGRYIVDPVGNGDLPIWVANYALADYGTGIVKCSCHDERDFAFAKKYNLKLKPVLFPQDAELRKKVENLETCYFDMKNGILSEPKEFNGKKGGDCRKEIIAYLEKNKLAQRKTTYKLRDWVFSRQRYWGEPIPVFHDANGKIIPVAEKSLPVVLPKVKHYEPTGTGESPLAGISKWVNVKTPNEKKYFIFDFDGVLGDTWNAALDTRIIIGTAKNKTDSARFAYELFNKKPHYARGHSLSAEALAENLADVKRFGAEVARIDFDLFDEFIQEIKKYKNIKCAVVSSGSEIYVKPKLKKSGIKFSHIFSYEDGASKEEKIERVCKEWGVDVKDIYYFTDTKADVYELENLLDRSKIIGCAWGYLGFDALKEVLPEEQILKNFKDVHTLIGMDHNLKRETNTMPQWAGSSWYYLRYMDPKDSKTLVDAEKEKYWNQVDFYVGGAEHATRHLIYARFWHKFLYDIGVVSTIEPFKKLQSVGLIMGEDGRKMSKRFGNVVNPDDIVKTYGADTMRIYEMFMGPFDQAIAWNTDSIIGSRRFIERIWKMAEKQTADNKQLTTSQKTKSLLHKTIKKVSEDIANIRFNTAISSLMILQNEFDREEVSRSDFEIYLKLIAPFAPHITEEIWQELSNRNSIHTSDWPTYDENLIKDTSIKIAIQINGKVRSVIEMSVNATEEEVKKEALSQPAIEKWIVGKTPDKIIYVKGRVINIIVNA